MADRYRTRHHVERVESDDFDLIDTLARVYDEPYADSSAIPTYRVCQLARKHVTVALSGDGGDESFGGYRRYRLHMMEERMRQPLPLALRRPVFGLLGRMYPKADWAPRVFRGKTTLQALARDSVQAYFHSMSILRDDMRSRLYSNTFKAQLAGYNAIEVFQRHAAKANHEDPLSLIQYLDLKTYLVGDINTKVDRASMAHSLEVREPLMDHPLVEWLATLPSSFKLRAGEGKWLFKQAMEPYLPKEVLYRPKMGFAVPLASWLRGPLKERVREAVLGDGLAETGMFDPGYLRQLFEQHQSGSRDHSAPLWSMLMFDAFIRQMDATHPSVNASPEVARDLGVTVSKVAVTTPRLLVFSSLFPSAVQPNAGLFIRERMFRVGKHLPIVVVAPQPWFPGPAADSMVSPALSPDGAEARGDGRNRRASSALFLHTGRSEMDRWSVHGVVVVSCCAANSARPSTPISSTLISATRPAMRRSCWDVG